MSEEKGGYSLPAIKMQHEHIDFNQAGGAMAKAKVPSTWATIHELKSGETIEITRKAVRVWSAEEDSTGFTLEPGTVDRQQIMIFNEGFYVLNFKQPEISINIRSAVTLEWDAQSKEWSKQIPHT